MEKSEVIKSLNQIVKYSDFDNKEIRYKMTAYICRRKENKLVHLAELQDLKQPNSVCIVELHRVKGLVEKEND